MANQELVNAIKAQKNAVKNLDDLASFLSSLRVETVHKNNGHLWRSLAISPPSHGLTLLHGCSTLVQAL